MEGRKENKYNLTGICPECGHLIKVTHVICVDLVEEGTSTKLEAEIDAGKEKPEGTGSDADKGDDLRPADETRPAGTTGAADKPEHSKKGRGNKKTGGE